MLEQAIAGADLVIGSRALGSADKRRADATTALGQCTGELPYTVVLALLRHRPRAVSCGQPRCTRYHRYERPTIRVDGGDANSGLAG